jgi:hypothetical protein
MQSGLLSLVIVLSLSLQAGDDNVILLPQTSANNNDRVQLVETVPLSQKDPLTNHTFEELIQKTYEQKTPLTLVAYNIVRSDNMERAYATKEYFDEIYKSFLGKETIISADNYNILCHGSNFTIEYVDSITNQELVFSLFPDYEA